jgi:hypothetical protein
MTEHAARARRLLALHQVEQLLPAQPLGPGVGVLLAWLGFQALATTSNGFMVAPWVPEVTWWP